MFKRSKTLLRRFSVLCALLLLFPTALQAQPRITIQNVDVRHIGPPAVSDQLIRSHIRVKSGDLYNPLSVDEDVRMLYSTGYFYNIRVLEENPSSQGLTLVYQVQGKPLLTDILFAGNKKYKESKLLKKVTSKTGEPLDERKLFMDARAIQEMYQKAGLQRTSVRYEPSINEQSGRGSVTFVIEESPKIRIEDVQFVGADAFKQRKLRRTIKTRRHWMWSWLTGSGKLKDDQFEEDKDKLAQFYRDAGYIDFEIKDIIVDEVAPNLIILRILVFEGNQYQVGKVEVDGNTLFSEEEIRSGLVKNGLNRVGLPMQEGDVFTPQGARDNNKAIRDIYEGDGYLTPFNEGNTRIRQQLNANTDTGTMDLSYTVQEGEQIKVEKIEIKGNVKTKDRVLRRELAISPGEVFDMTRVEISRLRLEGLNYFSKVDTTVEPTPVPNQKNLIIGVEEKPTGNFQVGAGFSTIDSLVGFAELTQGNFDLFKPPFFTGGGQKFRLRLQVGTRRQDYVLSFIEPYFFGRRLRFGVDLYHRELDFLSDDYDESRTGFTLSLTKRLPLRLPGVTEGGVSYTLENVEIQNIDPSASPIILQEEGERLVSKVGASLVYDTRGPGLLPDRGQRTGLFGEVAGGPFGADADFYKLELRSAWYFKGFGEGHVIEVAGQLGVVESYGNGDRGAKDRVPLFDRWYLGGMRNMRGYDFREVGPKDFNEEPIGGGTYWFGSIEYSIPLIDRLRFAVFYDAGMVYPQAYSFTPFGMGGQQEPVWNDNVGVGIRLEIPNLGPLRLDYAIPIQSDRYNGDGGKFQFGVGFTARNF